MLFSTNMFKKTFKINQFILFLNLFKHLYCHHYVVTTMNCILEM